MITGCLQIKNDTYYAVLYVKENGQRKQKWISTKLPVKGTGKRKAEQAFEQIRMEYEKKLLQEQIMLKQEKLAASSPMAQMQIVEYLYKWLEQSKPTISKTTYKSYKMMIDGRISRTFVKTKTTVESLHPQQIQDFYQTILDDGCTANTVIRYHALLQKAMQNAVRKDIIEKNPVDKVDRPKKNIYHAEHYNAEEMKTLFKAAQGDPIELCIKLAAYYGLRRSEVLGLKWSAIDFQNKTISIRHKVIEELVDGRYVPVGEDVLKTKSSFRTLPLIPVMEELLLEEKQKQETFRKLFKKSYCSDYLDYICLDEMGKLLRPNFVTEHFTWLLEKYDLKKIRFHDLRHSCASLLLANGISMKQIQIWLGHSTFATTADIYSHLDYSAQVESGQVMNGMYM